MTAISFRIFTFLFFVVAVSSVAQYKLVKIADPSALCLDGSPGAYYISEGDKNKFMLFFEGGGWCGDEDLSSTLQNCYSRSQTELGSSSGYQPTYGSVLGILSDSPSNYFQNWTKVFLKYCDGTGHQGSKLDPISYKSSKLYFRGSNITIGRFEDLQKKYNLFNATHIILSGESAGGLATFTWTNYLYGRILNHTRTKMWAIPDSGIFLDQINIRTGTYFYRTQIQNFMRLSNAQTQPPIPECIKQHQNQSWRCMFAQYLHPFLKAPIFPVQSLYDSWSMHNIIGVSCPTQYSLTHCQGNQLDIIEKYHQNTTQVLFEIGNKKENGFWAPVCVNHDYLTTPFMDSPSYRIPMHSEYSLAISIKMYLDGTDENHHHIDSGNWPSNKPCSSYVPVKKSHLFEIV